MADIKLSIGGANTITGYLKVNLRKAVTPLTIEDTQTFAPADLDPVMNIVFTNLDPGTYYVDFRNSPDGTSQGTILNSFEVEAETQIVVSERRFYTVDGGGTTPWPDPVSGGFDIADPYLDGKFIKGVQREGYRYLKPNGIEYDDLPGGGITLVGGQAALQSGEVVTIEVDYTMNQMAAGSEGIFSGKATIVSNTTLDSTYYNKKISCESPSSRLVITFDHVSSIPDGKFFHFTTNKGMQKQTRFITQDGTPIYHAGGTVTELSLGKGEYLWIEKQGSSFEVFQAHANVLMVGRIFDADFNDHPNTHPDDADLADGDDYPRLWWWLNHSLPGVSYIMDANVTNPSYTHPVGKEGLWVIHPNLALKKFRFPSSMGFSHRYMKDFHNYGLDTTRGYDYPGGTQPEMVGPHWHASGTMSNQDDAHTNEIAEFNRSEAHGVRSWNTANSLRSGQNTSTDKNKQGGVYTTENRVKNIGVVRLRCI